MLVTRHVCRRRGASSSPNRCAEPTEPDAGDGDAALRLAGLLAGRADLDGAVQVLREAAIGSGDAKRPGHLLMQQGRAEEAERLRRES